MSKILNTSATSYYLEELLKDLDFKLYRDLTDEVSHIIRVSNDILDDKEKSRNTTKKENDGIEYKKLTTSKLSKFMSISTKELITILESNGYIEVKNNVNTLARKAIQSQAEFRKGKFGDYFLWSKGLDLNKEPDSFTKKFIKAFL